MPDEGGKSSFFDPLDAEIAKENEAAGEERRPGKPPRPVHRDDGTEEEAVRFADWLDTE